MTSFIKQKISNLLSDKTFSEILTGSAWALVAQMAGIGLTLITSVIIARVYGAEMVGIIAMIQAFMMFATIITVLGTNTSILRLIPEHIAKYSVTSAFKVYRKTQWFVIAWALLISVGLYFSVEFIADTLFNKPYLSFYLMLAACFVVFRSIMDLNTQAVRGLRLSKTFAFMRIMPSLAILLVLVALHGAEAGTNSPVYAFFIGWTITAVAGVLIMDRTFRRRISPDDSVSVIPLPEIIRISAPMLMTASMQFIIGQTGVVLLGYFRSEAEVGYYALAVRLATLTSFMLQAINAIAAPKFSDLYNKGKLDELFHVAKKSTKLIFWATTPILLVLLLLGKPMLFYLFGAEFVVAYPAMVILVIGQFVNAITGSTGYFMNMTGHHTKLRNLMFITAVFNVVLNVILIPQMAIIGAAIAGMLSLCLRHIYLVMYIKKTFGQTIAYAPVWARKNG